MPHPLLILLSLLLLFEGCKESAPVLPEEPEEKDKVEVTVEQPQTIDVINLPDFNSTIPDKPENRKIVEVIRGQSKHIHIIDLPDPNTIDPNILILRKPLAKVDSPSHSEFIIRPDMSMDHKMIIIPGDPDIDPGIFIGKVPGKSGKRYKEIPD